jgi:hypothetical protein
VAGLASDGEIWVEERDHSLRAADGVDRALEGDLFEVGQTPLIKA